MDDFVKAVSEVLTVAPAEAQSDQGSQPAQEAAPADAPPPSIDLGQTKDQDIAGFGQPLRIANLGAKTIF